MCYVCGKYVYGKSRHLTCDPRYRRTRLFSCEKCGRMARGVRHQRCEGFTPAGYNPCAYCFGPTRGTYHKDCTPDTYEYAVFRDTPGVVQRRCVTCREWFPFASVDGQTIDHLEFAPRGHSKSGRQLYQGNCRACLAQMRRDREAAA